MELVFNKNVRLSIGEQYTKAKKIFGSYNSYRLQLENCVIPVSTEARSLGVIIQSDLEMRQHVQFVSRACFFHLRQLRSIRHSVDVSTASTLIHVFISSILDYCNSLLAGSTKVVTDVLQKIQNAVARLMTGSSRWQHDIHTIRTKSCTG
jgi:hypothetical protein